MLAVGIDGLNGPIKEHPAVGGKFKLKILVFGADGQVGWELQRSLLPLGEVTACSRSSDPAFDFSNSQNINKIIVSQQPDIIVNAAAYTAVDAAENDAETARRINCQTPEAIALAAREWGALLVHYSTDYVFDGQGQEPFDEEANARPLNVYGATKRDGEIAIQRSGCRHLIFRTSWVYARRGKNFVRTMIELSKSREELRVVADQIGAPTGAELIADVTAHAIARARSNSSLGGTYHLTADGETSWHGLAEYAIEQARQMGWPVVTARIHPIGSSEYPQKAVRPANSRLSTLKLRQDFGLHLPDWRIGVARVVKDLTQRQST